MDEWKLGIIFAILSLHKSQKDGKPPKLWAVGRSGSYQVVQSSRRLFAGDVLQGSCRLTTLCRSAERSERKSRNGLWLRSSAPAEGLLDLTSAEFLASQGRSFLKMAQTPA